MDPINHNRRAPGPPRGPDPFAGINIKALLAALIRDQPDLLNRFRETPPCPISPRSSEPEDETVPTKAAESHSSAEKGPSTPKPQEIISKTLPGPSAPTAKPIYVAEPHSETSPASSETDDFQTVQNKSQKRKLKASKSHANPPKKVGLEIPSTSSRSQAQPAQANPEEESEDSPMAGPPKERVPPLYIREKLSWQRILPILIEQGVSFEMARSTVVGIRVDCPSTIEHRRLTTILRENQVGYHTYALPDERVLRVVIRGLPKELDTELIKTDLQSQGLPVLKVHRMYNLRTRIPYEMVLVILELSPEGKKIHQLTSVCRLSGLKIESPYNRGKIGQCHRCQLYGHSARNCFAQPRCVKCLGDHGTADCARTYSTTDPPSCVLCKTQGHPANYRGCKKAPQEPKRRVKLATPKPTTTKPVEKFVAAPVPTQNAWAKPLIRASAPAPKPSQAPAALPAKPTLAATNLPAPSIPELDSDTANRTAVNFATVGKVLSTIDLEELDVFCKAVKKDALSALTNHTTLLLAIKNLQNSLNNA